MAKPSQLNADTAWNSDVEGVTSVDQGNSSSPVNSNQESDDLQTENPQSQGDVEDDAHAASVNNSPQIWSLDTFLKGITPAVPKYKYPRGHKQSPRSPYQFRHFWPKHLVYYALESNGANLLFEQKQEEFRVYLIPGAGSAMSINKTEKNMPFWLLLGMD